MFRKLMQLESEALRRGSDQQWACIDSVDAALLAVGSSLSRCVPALPQRFGVCAARFDS